LYLQVGRGDSPAGAGLTFVPLAAGNFVASLASSRLVARYGRTALTAGAGLQAVSLLVLLLAASPQAPLALVLAGLALFGLGQGLLIPPIIGVVLSRIPAADSGAAAGVLVTTQQLSGTVGIAIVSLGFFAAADAGRGGYITGFSIACACNVALALGSLGLSRMLSPRESTAAVPAAADIARADG
jgi:MFS family permease